jgi:MFS family permease
MTLDAPWRSLLIASLTMTVQNGVLLTFPVVYVALLEEFRWGRGQGAGIFAVTTLVIGLAGPLVGYLLDTVGPRRLFVSGAIVTAVGMATTGLGSVLPYFYATYGAVTGLGHSAIGSVPNMIVVSKWYPQGTGRAIALADVGTALGVILIVPAAQWMILQVGWRWTLWALAGVMVLVLAPAWGWPRIGWAGVSPRRWPMDRRPSGSWRWRICRQAVSPR